MHIFYGLYLAQPYEKNIFEKNDLFGTAFAILIVIFNTKAMSRILGTYKLQKQNATAVCCRSTLKIAPKQLRVNGPSSALDSSQNTMKRKWLKQSISFSFMRRFEMPHCSEKLLLGLNSIGRFVDEACQILITRRKQLKLRRASK